MEQDARVKSAIANWSPRMVSMGIDINDFQRVSKKLLVWDEWNDAWAEVGAFHEQLADEAMANGTYRSAAVHYHQASMAYHFGKYLFVHDMERLRAGTEKTAACYRKALPLFSPPGVEVNVPFEGTTLPGYMRYPSNVVKPAVVMIVCGLDSTKEEMHTFAELVLARGMAALCIDGPGQGESEFELSIRADYEKVITAAIDFLEGRPEVDATRVGLLGISLGGYYVCRGAAFEKRVRTAVDVAGPYAWGEKWLEERPPLTRFAFRIRAGAKTDEEELALARTLTLEGVAEKITCPLLVIHGGKDTVINVRDAQKIYDAASGPKKFHLLEDGNHVCNNMPYRYRPVACDWLMKHLEK